jgi:DNA gyrase subunit A
MRLRTLTGLQRDKIREEYDELMKQIDYYSNVLADVTLRMSIIKNELLEIKDKYGDARRSEIVFAGGDMRMEDLIADEAVVVTISHMGYIKRTSLSEYKRQTRGGVGSRASSTRDEDFLAHLISATNHNNMLFFTEKGKCYWLKVYELPEGTRQSKGRAIQNLINIEPDDKVKAYITVGDLNDQEYINNNFIIMCTKGGTIKKTSLESYSRPRVNGINAINVKEGDELIEAILTNGSNEIMIAVKSGRAIRFNESTVRPMGRTATGVKAISLDKENDEVVGMIGISDASTQTVLVVSQKGFGKRTFLNDPEDNEPVYRVTNRGGKGVKTISVTDKTGLLISLQSVTEDDDLMIITKKGTLIRMAVSSLRVMGRATQGVKLINLRGDDEIAAVTKVAAEEEEPEIVSDAELNVDGENINPENGDTPIENDSEPAAE